MDSERIVHFNCILVSMGFRQNYGINVKGNLVMYVCILFCDNDILRIGSIVNLCVVKCVSLCLVSH